MWHQVNSAIVSIVPQALAFQSLCERTFQPRRPWVRCGAFRAVLDRIWGTRERGRRKRRGRWTLAQTHPARSAGGHGALNRAFLGPPKWALWGLGALKAPHFKKSRGVPAPETEVWEMVKNKVKFALWITPEAKAIVEGHYLADNCKSQSEYIEKAVRFYTGYLDAAHDGSYLPRVLAEVLEGKLDALGKRIGRQLFKQSVEQDLMANLIAYDIPVDLDTLRKLRVQCIRNVKETNGEITLEDAGGVPAGR